LNHHDFNKGVVLSRAQTYNSKRGTIIPTILCYRSNPSELTLVLTSCLLPFLVLGPLNGPPQITTHGDVIQAFFCITTRLLHPSQAKFKILCTQCALPVMHSSSRGASLVPLSSTLIVVHQPLPSESDISCLTTPAQNQRSHIH
jgi:hypothetical protein